MSKKYKITVDGVEHIVEVSDIDNVIVDNNKNADTSIMISSDKVVTSPLQGTVQTIKVAKGQNVKEGEVVVIIEAMKMENDVPSTFTGIVKNILVKEGQTVDAETPLIEF